MNYQDLTKQDLIKTLNELQQQFDSKVHDLEIEIKQQKELTDSLNQDKFLMQTIIDNTPDAIFVKDTNWKYILFNKAAQKFIGKSSDQVLFHDDNLLFSTEEANEIRKNENALIEKKALDTYEEVVTTHNNKATTFLSTKGPVFGKNGKLLGLFGIARDITERKLEEAKLIESENKFRKIYEDGPYGMALVNNEFKFLMANNTFCQIVGYEEHELQKLSFIDISYPDDLKNDIDNVAKLIKGEIPVLKTEKRYIRKNGTVIWASLTVTAHYNQEGQFLYNLAIINDITLRKQTELMLLERNNTIEAQNEEYLQINEELIQTNQELFDAKNRAEESEETYRMLFDSINDAVFISEVVENGTIGCFIKVNNIACNRLGYTQDELLRLKPFDITSDKIKQTFNTIVQSVFEKKRIIVESEHVTKSGQIIPVEISTHVTSFRGKTIIHSIARDITARKKNLEALRQSEDKFRKAFLTNPDSITINRIDDGMYTSVNLGFISMFGFSEHEVIGKTSKEINIWHDYSEREHFIQLLNQNGFVENLEARFNTKSGQILDGLIFSRIIELDDTPHIITITRNITQQKKNDENLKESQNLLFNLARLVPGVIYQYQLFPNGHSAFPYSSSGMFSIYEVTPEEVKEDASPVFDRLHPDDFDEIVKRINESAENLTTFYCEFRVILPVQGLRWRWSQAHPTRMEDGSTLWHGIISDITERKEAELELQKRADFIELQNEEYQKLNKILTKANEELIIAKEHAEQSDRLKTAFLQNMSHEIRTPMNAIMGFSSLLPNQFDNKTKLVEYSQIINQRCADLLQIINEILDVAKIESGQLSVALDECNLESLLSEISLLFKEFQLRQNKHHIPFKVISDFGTTSSIIQTDKTKLKQILINLISNAFKFTDKGEVVLTCEIIPNEQIVFSITDTGIGIPTDKLDFIFKRFAQLESPSDRIHSGTGLGLSIVKGLLDLLHGQIYVDSIIGKGTTFRFTLPYQSLTPSSAKAIIIENNFTFNFTDKTILIVEDDIFNAEFLNEILTVTKANIIHSNTGIEAIKIAKSTAIDVILMDIRLPDIDGYEATKQIRRINREVIIIAQTAYATDEDKKTTLIAGFDGYISKPIKRDDILALIYYHFKLKEE